MAPERDPDTTQSDTPADGVQLEPVAVAMTPKSTRKRAAESKTPWVPPRGIRYELRADRPAMPHYLHWRDPYGQRKKQAFKDEASRELVARELAAKRDRQGSSILSFDPDEWRVWLRFKDAVGSVDPLVVAHEWKAAKGVGAKAESMTVATAVDRYLNLREKEGGIDKGYLSHITLHLRRSFAIRLGTVRLHELHADQIREWLDNLKGRVRKGATGALGIEARQHYYRTVHAFLARAVTEQWVTRNVCDIVAKPMPTLTELARSEVIKLMPVADVEALFRANRTHRVVGRLALEAFGGVRYTTAGKMTADHIDFERKGLAMPGAIHKSRKRKFRQGHPPALWAWLEHVKAHHAICWTMTEREYYNEKRDAFIRADVKNPHNGLRHSFASYLLADTKDLPRVSYLMQHSKTTMTEKYEGRATEADAKRYLAIFP